MINCTGAGDSLVAGMVYGLLDTKCQHGDLRQPMRMGVAAARMSVESCTAISPNLSPDALFNILAEK